MRPSRPDRRAPGPGATRPSGQLAAHVAYFQELGVSGVSRDRVWRLRPADPEPSPAAAPEPVAAPAPAVAPEPAAEPVQIAQADDGFDLQATYQMFCFACHSTGLSGAPLPGDAEAWGPRMEKGRDEIVAIMNRGLNAMPPKGLCMTCTDDQLWELSQYMVTLEQ